MRKLTVVLLSIVLASIALAQSPQLPYANELVGMIKETHDFAVKDGDTLRLDVYYNPTVEYKGKRPIIIFSFGGGWEAGARADGGGTFTPFLNRMTRFGYVMVGIDYRLGYLNSRLSGRVQNKSISASLIERNVSRKIFDEVCNAIEMAVEDLYDATTFMVQNADKWNADPECVIIGGISAGGVNSITAENWSANNRTIAQNHLPENFRYAGVISGCGAIWHDDNDPVVWNREPCPVLFFHGDSDNIVPFDEWHWDDGKFTITGSRNLSNYFNDNNLPYIMVAGTGGTHDFGGYPFAIGQDKINMFITRLVLNKEKSKVEIVETPIQ